MPGDRSFEVWHGGESIPAGDTVNLAIPRTAPKTVIEPFDGRARQPSIVATQKIHHFSLESAVITLAVEHAGAGTRIKTTIEAPQNFADRVSPIEQVKKIAKDFATTTIYRNRVTENPPRRFFGLRTVMENAGIAVSVSR